MSCSLRETLVLPARLDAPADWFGALPFSRRIAEIGFGNGEFLFHRSGLEPQVLHLGIEVSLRCIDKAARRVYLAGRRNVRLILGDGRFLLREAFPEAYFEGIFMHFPCPWPKTRHARRRVTTPDFIETLASALAEGGFFELLTDEEAYALAAQKAMGGHPSFRLESFEVDPVRPVTTKYERKWLEMGKPIFRLHVVKTAPARVAKISGGGSGPMHIVLPGARLDAERLRAASSLEGGTDDARWVVCNSYSGVDGSGLVQVVTCDEGFEQRFYIRLVPREDDCLVKVDDASYPFNTPAVQAAIGGLAALLEKRS
ncbi:tRNA (guanosine(46)-N7)-methyltransferase TrmB [Aminirod propionatiphilus]|uniref:tRNA (Guanosine(46)-N7)-methyltransferase TrmB n=1 Tax=Aminirod propionatiphilus TaxID=3415223 RepID=A0ACD1DYN9_9BACT|nr:tRNA (guanosine(46)-N7)-methyltransferase TrmB [Synergistota bacterium]